MLWCNNKILPAPCSVQSAVVHPCLCCPPANHIVVIQVVFFVGTAATHCCLSWSCWSSLSLVEDLVDCSKCSPRSWDGTGSSQELAPAQEHWVEIHVEQNNLVLICCCQVPFDNLSKLFVVDKVVFDNADTQKLTSRWRWWERSWGISSPQWARWLGSQQATPDGEENEIHEDVDF